MSRLRFTSACLALTLFLALPIAAQASPADTFAGPGRFARLWSQVLDFIDLLLPIGDSSPRPRAAVAASGLGADPNG